MIQVRGNGIPTELGDYSKIACTPVRPANRHTVRVISGCTGIEFLNATLRHRHRLWSLRAETSNHGGSGASLQLPGSGLNLNPLSTCWENEETLDMNDITNLLAACGAGMMLTDKLHLLILCPADCAALPEDLLPANHAVHRIDEHVTDYADGDHQYDAVLLFGGMKNVAEPKETLKKVLHVLKPGGNLIVLARHAVRAALTGDAFATPYPASVRQLLFSTGFCDIQELDVPRPEAPVLVQGCLRVYLLEAEEIFRPGVLCAVVGSRPGTSQGLEAALAADSTGYSSRSAVRLADIMNRKTGELTKQMRSTWLNAFNAMREEAMLMGIPSSAVPKVSSDASLEELQSARERLSGMIASFLSSEL